MVGRRLEDSIVDCVVPKLPLGAQCQSGDVCLDASSTCRNSICQCDAGYFPRASRCGQYVVLRLVT